MLHRWGVLSGKLSVINCELTKASDEWIILPV